MLLKTFKVIVGTMGIYTNSYVVADEASKEGILIDPAGEVDKIYNYIENSGIKLKYIIITHCHGDHIAGLKGFKRYYPNVKIVIHELDKAGLTDDSINLCTYIDISENFIDADVIVKDGDLLEFGKVQVKIIYTPGHTKGSISLLIKDALFSGDTLFKGAWGRTDLPTSDFKSIIRSIEQKLMTLPENTIVYPGHGAISIIREEKGMYI
jgi:glyoxylase-like metal-dependent hydrolase (beta-lactamase superfamily II)